MTITITGDALIKGSQRNTDRISLLPNEQLRASDSCLKHLPQALDKYELSGGYIELHFDADESCWKVRTIYESGCPLTGDAVSRIVKFTCGQWSDGHGSGCFSPLEDEYSVRIDLSPWDAKPVVVRTDSSLVALQPEHRLHNAVRAGNLALVRTLLESGVDGNAIVYGAPLLCTAVGMSNTEIAKELIERDVDVAVRDDTDSDALINTAWVTSLADEDAAEIAIMLLSRGVNPNGTRDGYTPLQAATHRKKVRLQEVIREFGGTE